MNIKDPVTFASQENNTESQTLKPEQKTILLHSIANYLENIGAFSKTLKKFKSEAKFEVCKTNLLTLSPAASEVHHKLFPREVSLMLHLFLQSSASFFQDNSVPLGRLIGIRPGNGALYFPRRVHVEEREKIGIGAMRAASSEVSGARRADMSQGICIPLLFGTLEKMGRSKSKSKQ